MCGCVQEWTRKDYSQWFKFFEGEWKWVCFRLVLLVVLMILKYRGCHGYEQGWEVVYTVEGAR